MRICIVGGGAIGSSVAYWLSRLGQGAHDVTLLERRSIACAASGKAGGFLARDWGNGATRALHELSFALHRELADELGIESYRTIKTSSLSVSRGAVDASWLSGDRVRTRFMDDATAQVTPLELCTKLCASAVKSGVQVREGAHVVGLMSSEGAITGVELAGGEKVSSDVVVICAGPWSTIASEWLGINIPMEGIKSTSVIFTEESHPMLSKAVKTEPVALFCDEDENGCHLEVYPRPNGEVYLCGIGGSDYVNERRLTQGDCDDPDKILADPKRVQAAVRSFNRMVEGGLGDNPEPAVVQACMRPCPPDGLPLMGPAGELRGAFLAAGHNCWGILWSLVTGKVMAELILEGKSSVDLKAFDPNRFTQGKGRSASRRGRARVNEAVGEQW